VCKGFKLSVSSKQSRLQTIGEGIAWAALFTLAYAQAPLYTSNQNQYFLHGLAKAGYGYLSEDWLANTLDPTPVFSKFIEISWRILPWPPVFYLYFGLLAGVYLFSLTGIIQRVWGLETRAKRRAFWALMILLHSAVLRYLIARPLGEAWNFFLDGGVAGQRLLGAVLQPSTFGVFLLLGIALFLEGRRFWAIFSLLIAATFHPTYMLSAGVLTAVFMGITFWETRKPYSALGLGLAALIGVSPTLWHSLIVFGGSDPESTARAREILVNFRIPHHALVSEWLGYAAWLKLGFLILALGLLFFTRKFPTRQFASSAAAKSQLFVFQMLFWPALLAAGLTAVQVFSGNVELALLFPWRLSTWLVPLAVSVLTGWGLNAIWPRFHWGSRFRPGTAISLVIALLLALAGMAKTYEAGQVKQNSPDRPMMAFIRENKESGQVYLIPTKMQDFRLETGAPAYAEFKSIPYQAEEVLFWYHKVLLAGDFYRRGNCVETLIQLRWEGVTHLVLPPESPGIACPGLMEVYADEAYGVYRLPQR